MVGSLKIKRNTLFAIGYIILFIQFWTKDIIEISEYIFYVPSFALLLLSINFNKFKTKEWVTVILTNLIGVTVFLFSKSMTILKITLILSSLKGKDIDNLMKNIFWFSILILLLHLFASIVLDIGRIYVKADFGRGIVEKRYYFGFSHANALHLLCNLILISYLYAFFIKKKDFTKRCISVICCVIFSFVIYKFTKSRTGLIIGIMSIVLSIAYSEKNTDKFRILKNYKILSMAYIGVIAMVLGIIYFCKDTVLYNYLDKLMSNRLYLTNYFIDKYKITLFGQEISTVFKTIYGYKIDIVFDQGIINPLINYGLVSNLMIYILELKLIKKCCLEKQYNKIMIIMIMIVYSITESILFYPFTNLSILFMSKIIFKDRV